MITAYIGECGSGKTLLLAYMAYQAAKKKQDIYANFKLNIKFKELKRDFFINYAKQPVYKGFVGMDEIHVYFPARRATSKRNVDFTEFITQTRKRALDFQYTTQLSGSRSSPNAQVDVNIRDNTDYLVFTQMMVKPNKFNTWMNKPPDWKHHDGDLYMLTYTKFNRFWKLIKRRKIYPANPLFRLYDTEQIITFD